MSHKPAVLDDYLELVTYGFTNPMPDANEGPWKITAKDVMNGEINFGTARKTTQEAYDKNLTNKSRPKIGDVLLTKDGTLGRLAIVKQEGLCISQSVAVLRTNQNLLPEYLFYLLTTQKYQRQMIGDSDGTAIKHIYITRVGKMEVNIPSVAEQKLRLNYLVVLDEKIRINQQINQTLEQMAQAIFKSWFVDFEPVKAKSAALEAGGSEDDALLAAMQAIAGSALFATDAADADAHTQLARLQAEHPEQYTTLRATAELFPSAMQESELGEIPEGWSVAALADFGDVVCGKTPSKQKAEYYGSEVPFIKIPDMHGNIFVTKANEYLSSEGAASQPKKSIPKGSVCVSCIATVGLVVIAIEDSHTNQQINSIVPKKDVYTPYLYFRMQSLNKHLHDLASGGSATLNLNTSTFSKIQIIKPAEAVLEKYHEVTAKLLNKILEGSLENQTLSELRDTLLPKLLSGELSVSAAADQITQAEEAIDV